MRSNPTHPHSALSYDHFKQPFLHSIFPQCLQPVVAILGIFIQSILCNTQQAANYLLGGVSSLGWGEACSQRQENTLRERPGWEMRSALMMCEKPNSRKVTPSPTWCAVRVLIPPLCEAKLLTSVTSLDIIFFIIVPNRKANILH